MIWSIGRKAGRENKAPIPPLKASLSFYGFDPTKRREKRGGGGRKRGFRYLEGI